MRNSATITLHLNDPDDLKIQPLRDDQPGDTIYVKPSIDAPSILMSPQFAMALNKALTDYFATLAREHRLVQAAEVQQ